MVQQADVQPVSRTTLAPERRLPVVSALEPLLPDGLARGRTVGCRGPGATSLALALAAGATTAGAWLAVVDVPGVGIEAAAEAGVPLERLVRIDTPRPHRATAWADLVRVALDGFELVLTRPPAGVGETLLHKVNSQVRAREAVLVTLGGQPADVVLEADRPEWEGPEAGYGRLYARRLTLRAGGRRAPRERHAELWLPDARAVGGPLDERRGSPPETATPRIGGVAKDGGGLWLVS